MASRLPKLPDSDFTRAKKAASARRRAPMSAETKAKISAYQRGSKRSGQALENLRAGRRAVERTDEEKIAGTLARSKARPRAQRIARTEQWLADVSNAVRLGDVALTGDVRRSRGWLRYRRVFDETGIVSYGYYDGAVRWSLAGLRHLSLTNETPDEEVAT